MGAAGADDQRQHAGIVRVECASVEHPLPVMSSRGVLDECVEQSGQARHGLSGVLQVDGRDGLVPEAVDHPQLRPHGVCVQPEDALQLGRRCRVHDAVHVERGVVAAAANRE